MFEGVIRFYAVTDRVLNDDQRTQSPPQYPECLERDFVSVLIVCLCCSASFWQFLGDLLASGE